MYDNVYYQKYHKQNDVYLKIYYSYTSNLFYLSIVKYRVVSL